MVDASSAVGAPIELIIAITAIEMIVVGLSIQEIIPAIAIQPIIAGAAVHPIASLNPNGNESRAAAITVHHIISTIADDDIVARISKEGVRRVERRGVLHPPDKTQRELKGVVIVEVGAVDGCHGEKSPFGTSQESLHLAGHPMI
jgi:hypothetical protein